MDIQIAADKCRTAILNNGASRWYVPEEQYELSVGHVIAMLDQIVSGDIADEKAHRWLGWAQACMCMGNIATLDELKQINKDS